MSALIVIMEILGTVGSITVDPSDDPTEYSYQWITMKVCAIIINTINFISIFVIYRVFMVNRQQQLKDSLSKETFASSFIDMRIKQLKHLSFSYLVFFVYGVIEMILLFSFTHLKFLDCNSQCNVPTEVSSSIYMFISTILFLNMSFTIAYVFYIIPRNFNARLLSSNKMETDLQLGIAVDDETDQINDSDVKAIPQSINDSSNFRTKSDISVKPKRVSGTYNTQINELDLIDDLHLEQHEGKHSQLNRQSRNASNKMNQQMDPNQFIRRSEDEYQTNDRSSERSNRDSSVSADQE